MKSNIHKKLTDEDKFARKYFCKNASLNSIREDKKYNKRKLRRISRKDIRRMEDSDAFRGFM